jgi:hypothetical protein
LNQNPFHHLVTSQTSAFVLGSPGTIWLEIMATRSRKVVDSATNGHGRVGRPNASATPSATQRVAPTRATRSTRTVATPVEESTTSVPSKSRTVPKKGVVEKTKPVATTVKKAPAKTKTKTLTSLVDDENDREPIKV